MSHIFITKSTFTCNEKKIKLSEILPANIIMVRTFEKTGFKYIEKHVPSTAK